MFNWEEKNPAHPASDIRCYALRNAFDVIAKAVIPLLDQKYAYFSDLLWDAHGCARMEVGDTLYILVRDVGTHLRYPHDQSIEALRDALDSVMAEVDANPNYRGVVKVERAHYDTFRAACVYQRTDRTEITA